MLTDLQLEGYLEVKGSNRKQMKALHNQVKLFFFSFFGKNIEKSSHAICRSSVSHLDNQIKSAAQFSVDGLQQQELCCGSV